MNRQLLKQLIKDAGYSHVKFAKEAGLSPNTVSNIVTGTCYPSHYAMISIVMTLKLSSEQSHNLFFSQEGGHYG